MPVRVSIIIADKDGVESYLIAELINRVELTSRRAAIATLGDIGTDIGVPNLVTDAAAFRIWINPESLFWIDNLGNGSKWIKGIIYTAIITTVLKATIGESLSEGWQQTKIHSQIVDSIPKIEDFFVKRFEEYFSSEKTPDTRLYDAEKVAIKRDDDIWILEVRARPRRWSPSK